MRAQVNKRGNDNREVTTDKRDFKTYKKFLGKYKVNPNFITQVKQFSEK